MVWSLINIGKRPNYVVCLANYFGEEANKIEKEANNVVWSFTYVGKEANNVYESFKSY